MKKFITIIFGKEASAIIIDFDSLPGMNNDPNIMVPLSSQLSDQFLSTFGVSFSSDSDYVAIVNRGGRVCLDRQKRFISDKLPVHAATLF